MCYGRCSAPDPDALMKVRKTLLVGRRQCSAPGTVVVKLALIQYRRNCQTFPPSNDSVLSYCDFSPSNMLASVSLIRKIKLVFNSKKKLIKSQLFPKYYLIFKPK